MKDAGSDEPEVAGSTPVRPAAFYTLTFAVSWVIWGVAAVSDLGGLENVLIVLGAYGPLLSALVIAHRAEGAWSWFRRVAGVRGRWGAVLLGGLALPLLVSIAHLVIYGLVDGSAALSSDPPWYWAITAAPVNVFLLFWLGSGVEEFGWQGMGLPGLLSELRPLYAALVHGVLWGTWHLPLYLLDSWNGGNQSVAALYGITLTLTPIMVWLTGRADGGVMPAVLFHTATNHYSTLYRNPPDGVALFDPPLTDHFDVIKIGIYLAVAVVVVVGTRRRLRAD